MKQKKIYYHSVAVFVKNMDRSKEFYTGILDQDMDRDFGKNIILKSGISLWEVNPSHIIPKRLGDESINNEKAVRFELYFETDDVESVFRKLKENNVGFLHPIHEEPWGQKTIRFFDPDRHLIEIGESMETFVVRLAKDMTPEQVSEKTSVPLSVVEKIISHKS